MWRGLSSSRSEIHRVVPEGRTRFGPRHRNSAGQIRRSADSIPFPPPPATADEQRIPDLLRLHQRAIRRLRVQRRLGPGHGHARAACNRRASRAAMTAITSAMAR